MSEQSREEAMEQHHALNQRGLMGTHNAMIWAEEFVRVFRGKVVGGGDMVVDEGLMVGWFANAMEIGGSSARDHLAAQDALQWAFLQNYHLDKSNACVHCAPVKFSPITFRLSDMLTEILPTMILDSAELAEVREHRGQYDLDPGR